MRMQINFRIFFKSCCWCWNTSWYLPLFSHNIPWIDIEKVAFFKQLKTWFLTWADTHNSPSRAWYRPPSTAWFESHSKASSVPERRAGEAYFAHIAKSRCESDCDRGILNVLIQSSSNIYPTLEVQCHSLIHLPIFNKLN